MIISFSSNAALYCPNCKVTTLHVPLNMEEPGARYVRYECRRKGCGLVLLCRNVDERSVTVIGSEPRKESP